MAVERMPITPEVLTWARERLGYSQEALAAKRTDFRKIAEWEESGKSRPTYRQLEKLAKDLWLPVAVFFFPEPPETPKIEETFRTLGSEQFAEIPPGIRLLLHKARGFQIGLDELNDGRNPARKQVVRDFPLQPTADLAAAAARIREYLGVSLNEQFGWKNDAAALKAWRSAFYDVGIAVFKDAFGDDNYSGFCLYDTEFPVIYVNNSNTKTRQIFTLFHELAHLLFETSGVERRGDFRQALAHEHAQIEQRCNELANEILVPAAALDDELRRGYPLMQEAERLAKRFSVSSQVIYRNFKDEGLITQNDYETAVAEWNAQWQSARKNKKKRSGGDPYRTKLAYLGEDYVELAFRRYHEERIDDEELADYLSIPPKQIDKLEQTFLEER